MKTFAVGGEDNQIHIFEGFKKKKTLKGHTGFVYSLAFLSDELLASSGEDNTIIIWNFKTGECIQKLEGHTKWVFCLHFIPPYTLLSGAADETVKIWNILDWSSSHSFFRSKIRGICDKDKDNVYVLTDNDIVHILNLKTVQSTVLLTVQGSAYSICRINSENNQFAVGTTTGKIFVYQDDSVIKTLEKHSSITQKLRHLPSGDLLSGSRDNQAILWNLESEKPKFIFRHTKEVDGIGYLDDKTYVTADWRGIVCFWDNEGQLIEENRASDLDIRILEVCEFLDPLLFIKNFFQKRKEINVTFHFK